MQTTGFLVHKTSAFFKVASALAFGLSLCASVASATVPARPSNGSGGKVGSYPTETIVVNGTTRTYYLYVPSTLPAGAAVPLLFAFHGCCGDSPAGMAAYTGFNGIADQQNFIVIYPAGLNGSWATQTTNSAVDMAFVDALFALATSSYNIDLNRFYMTGMSEGAGFANIATALRSSEVAAEAPHSGTMSDVATQVNLGKLVINYKYGVNAVVGQNDKTVPPIYSQNMIATYQSWGQPTLLVIVPGLGHSWGDITTISNGIWSFLIAHPMQLVTVPPVISAVSAQTTMNSATVAWTTNTLSNSKVDYGPTTAYTTSATNATMVTAHTVSITGLVAGTVYHFRVNSTDAWGNQAVSGDFTFTTAPGNTLPVISSFLVNPTAITLGQSATLSWSTLGATSLSLDQGVGTVTGTTSKLVTPGITTTYTLTATNSTGSVKATTTLTVNSAVNQKPTGSFDPITTSGSIGGWAEDPDNVGVPITVNVYIDLNAGQTGAVPIPVVASAFYSNTIGNHGFTYAIPNVYRDSLSHTVWVWGADLTDTTGANNTQLLGSPQTFTFAPIDNSPPVITYVIPTTVLPFTASIGWLTNEPATSQIQYGTTSSYGSLSALNVTLATVHATVISGLRPGITYHYSVISADAAGNVAMSPDATIFTP